MSRKQNYEGHRASPEYKHPARRRSNAIRRGKPAMFVAVILVIIAVIALVMVLWLKNGGNRSQIKDGGAGEVTTDVADATLTGTWAYGEYTHYDFESNGSGAMRLDDTVHPYTYSINGDQLYLDFESDSVADATYTYTVSGNTLTLVGGDGTTGGAYELTKDS